MRIQKSLNTSLTCGKSKVINLYNAFLTKACTHEYTTKNSCILCWTVFSKAGASVWEPALMAIENSYTIWVPLQNWSRISWHILTSAVVKWNFFWQQFFSLKHCPQLNKNFQYLQLSREKKLWEKHFYFTPWNINKVSTLFSSPSCSYYPVIYYKLHHLTIT